MADISPYDPAQADSVMAVWQAAAGAHHPLTAELWSASTAGDPGFEPADLLIAHVGDACAGFVLTKRWRGQVVGCERYADVGYLALMAVHPTWQGQGIGRQLLADAECRMRLGGVTRIVVGGSFHHLLPGVPTWAMAARHVLTAGGYTFGHTVWDVRRRLGIPPALPAVTVPAGLHLRPFADGETAILADFLQGTFPGRWYRDLTHFVESGGPIGHVMGVFDGDRPCGFAHLHPPGSPGTARWAGLAPGIAAFGPIGVAEDQRGRGLGLALLVAGLQELKRLGADDTVIDWTDLLDFYGRVGFQPWLSYTLAHKDVT